MNNQGKHQEEIEAILLDVAEILKTQGKSETEISEALLQLVARVEMAVVEELIADMPEDKRKKLDEMGEQKKSPEDIAQMLELDPEKTQEIEMRKFEELAGQLAAKLVDER